MGQRNLRIGRCSERGRTYHVTATTQKRRPVFADLTCGRILVNALRWSDAERRTATWGFVVMPDHLHWLFELEGSEPLPKVVSSVKKYSSRRIRSLLQTGDRVWATGYHDHAIRRAESLVDVARYIVTNPVRAGLVDSLNRYPLWDARWIEGGELVDPDG